MCCIVAIVFYYKVCERVSAEPELCDSSSEKESEEKQSDIDNYGLHSSEWSVSRLLARMEEIDITFEDLCACRERDLTSSRKSKTFSKVNPKVKKELGAAVRKVTIDLAKKTIEHLLDNYIPRGNDRVARENIHSVYVSRFLTPEHQLLLEELSVALYHDRPSGAFLNDAMPGQVDKGAVLDCVNKGIIEAAIALRWIKPTRSKRSVRITNQQAPILTEKNKRKVNEVSTKKSSEIITASDDIPFASIAASSSIPITLVAAELPPVVELSAVSFVSEVEIDKEGDEEVGTVLMSRSVLFLL